MKYIFFLTLLLSLNSLNAMHHPKLTTQEVVTLTNRQLTRRLVQEGERVRVQLGEENFQKLIDVWVGEEDVQRVVELYEGLEQLDDAAIYRNMAAGLYVEVSGREIKTKFLDGDVVLEKLEFCGFAMERKRSQARQSRQIQDLLSRENFW